MIHHYSYIMFFNENYWMIIPHIPYPTKPWSTPWSADDFWPIPQDPTLAAYFAATWLDNAQVSQQMGIGIYIYTMYSVYIYIHIH